MCCAPEIVPRANSPAVLTSINRGRSSLSRSVFNCAASRVSTMRALWRRRDYSKVNIPLSARQRAGLSPDPFQQSARRPPCEQRDRFEPSAPSEYFRGAHSRYDIVVAAFDDDVGMTLQNELQWRWLVERNDRAHRLQRCEDRHPLLERVERAVDALVQGTRGRVGIDADHQRGTEAARVVEVGHVPAMKDVEDAVAKDQGTTKFRDACREILPRDQLGGERGRRNACQLRYSNTLTTRWTPLVVRAISAAASPSSGRTMPIR